MINLEISPYKLSDNSDALKLEDMCPQGKALSLRFVRPTFHARSEVYQDYRILTAKSNNKLIGVAAGAKKKIKVGGEIIYAIYGYDLRVHPDYRKYGTAKILTEAVIKEFGDVIDCAYTLIAGENESALSFIKRSFGAKVVIPLTYLILPVYRRIKESLKFQFTSASEIHYAYIQKNPGIELLSEFDEKYLLGHVNSISLGQKAGCSIWTNENLISEQVIKIPVHFNLIRLLFNPLKLFMKFPSVPKQDEIIQSWFLYDLYAEDINGLKEILSAVNNFAYSKGKKFIYILLQTNDPLIKLVQKSRLLLFTYPYFFLANKKIFPKSSNKIYIDIRDL